MSLLDRVNAAAPAPVAAELEVSTAERFSALFQRVGDALAGSELAKIEGENPTRAHAEVRSICDEALRGSLGQNISDEERRDLIDQVINAVFGFGPLTDLLEDETITEIMVNGPRAIYYERNGKLFPSDKCFSSEEQLRALIDRIVGPLGRRIDESSPMVNARLPQGHRVNAIIEPLALNGSTLTIRKFANHLITLSEMQAAGSLDATMLTFLAWAVAARKNIAVSGGTGSGKTTFLNALSCYIPLDERVITIEDSAELRFNPQAHVVRLEARPRNAEGQGEVTIRDLVTNALRMRPDRIVVGECRGAEALDMLQAMNTGHDGSLTTLHANSTTEVPSRLATMVRYASEIPVAVIESYIASALDLVIQMTRGLSGDRFVCEIAALRYDQEEHRCIAVPLYRRSLTEKVGRWEQLPCWVDELPLRGAATEEEVRAWKQQVSCA